MRVSAYDLGGENIVFAVTPNINSRFRVPRQKWRFSRGWLGIWLDPPSRGILLPRRELEDRLSELGKTKGPTRDHDRKFGPSEGRSREDATTVL